MCMCVVCAMSVSSFIRTTTLSEKQRDTAFLPSMVRKALFGGVLGGSPGRDHNLAEAFREAPTPMLGLLSPVVSCPLFQLWLIEIGGESDTQPHSYGGSLGCRLSLNEL